MGMEGGRTHELDTPSEEGCLKVLIIVEFTALEDLDGVDDRDTTVELPTWDVVIEVLCTYTAGKRASTRVSVQSNGQTGVGRTRWNQDTAS